MAASDDNGVQIIDISDPASPVPVASFDDGDTVGGKTYRELQNGRNITTVKIGSSTYALVAALDDDGVQIIDISDPASPVPAASFDDGDTVSGRTYDELNGAVAITTARIGSGTYALVAALEDNGVQIIDISDPASPVPVASFDDGDTVGDKTYDTLHGATNITSVKIGSGTYVLVAAFFDNGVQIIGLGEPPVDAGRDQTVREGATVTLSGTAADPENAPFTYQWTHDSSLSIGLADDTVLSTTFVAPAVTADTTVTFTLTASDGTTSTSDTVSVTIADNRPPTADAGQDQTVREGATVTLSGTASDFENDPLTYQWTHDSSLSIGLADDAALSTSFTAPPVTADTTFTFTLTVSDGTKSASDTVSVTIADNNPPTADAGQDQTVREGATVTLSGTASDPENDPLAYRWTHDSSLSIGLADDTAFSTSFTAPPVTADTTVTFTLAVSDGIASASDTVSVTIADNNPPTADAGQDQTVREGATVTLSGTASDPENDPLAYRWTHDSSLSIGLADDTAFSTSFTAPPVTADTTVTFTLAVSDGIASAADTVSVTISDNNPPTVDAGQDRTVDKGATVTLSGTASDPDNDPLAYRWTHDSSLSISLGDDTALVTTFIAPRSHG